MRLGVFSVVKLMALAAAGLVATEAAGADLRGAGATFPSNLYAAWIAKFAEMHPEDKITYEPVGSGEGIRQFLAGKVDFGGTDRPIDDGEFATAPDGVLHVPATAGMVVVAYNLPGIEGELRLGRTALAGIFAGEIRNWDDPIIVADNPGLVLPHRSVAVVGRRDSSGTTFAFTSHLSAISDLWRLAERSPGMIVDWPGGAMTAVGNEGVAGRIDISEYSVGYVEYSFARLLDLPVAALQNREGQFVRPAIAAGTAALAGTAAEMPEDGRLTITDPAGIEAYPIVSYSWLLVHERYQDPGVAEALRAFVGWGLSEGQALAEPIGYIPLPNEVVVRASAILEKVQ